MKRRYARQNREIVRTNTAQSARIRNLECEVTRLLNENLAWREEAISAKAEAEKWKASHRLNKEVIRMKEQIEAKLEEVNALVGDLGSLPEKVARRSSQKRRRDGFVSELVVEREPRQRQTISEADGRLPAIMEDKYYPRRTMEVSQIVREEDLGESPDIGPPPVAHFDADAVVFDAARSPRRTSTELIEESERTNRPSVTIIESRRKRRTSSLLSNAEFNEAENDEQKMEIDEPVKQDPTPLPSILKKGAKRKIEASELEDTSKVSKELDEFIFQRKPQSNNPPARPSRFARPTVRTDQPQTEQPARRVLAAKSTNSPAKRKLADYAGTEQNLKPIEPTRRVVSRIRRPAQANSQDEEHASQEPVVPPITPAPDLDDLLSPISTEPQQHKRLSKEAAITNSVEDVLNGSIGRGSRRRAAVSYAEPNLRDKMRRPGKELVSAIEGLSRQTEEATQSRAIELPKQDTRQQDRSEPASPTPGKSQALTDKPRRSIEMIDQSVFDPPRSSSPVEERPRSNPLTLKTRRHSVQTGDSVLRTRRTGSVEIKRDEVVEKGHVRKVASTTTLPSSRSLKNGTDHAALSDRGSDSESQQSQRLPRGGLSRRRSLMV